MKENHRHYCGWIIYWDESPTERMYRFWIAEFVNTSDDGLSKSAEYLHHMDIYPSIWDGIDQCEQLISSIILDQTQLTYRKVSDYHHSRNPSTETDTGNTDEIPF